jgi:hypothetical protein
MYFFIKKGEKNKNRGTLTPTHSHSHHSNLHPHPHLLAPTELLKRRRPTQRKYFEWKSGETQIKKCTSCSEGTQMTKEPIISPGLMGVSTCSLKKPPGSYILICKKRNGLGAKNIFYSLQCRALQIKNQICNSS